MYQLIYHGSDKTEYHRIRTGLPEHFRLSLHHNRDRIIKDIATLKPDGLILSLRNPNSVDLGYLKKIISIPSLPGVVVMAGGISVQQAVCCMKLGVYDCLSGSADGEILGIIFDRMLSERSNRRSAECRGLIGNSQAIIELRNRLKQYADLDCPVLITGETGTGKELVAQAIHHQSKRKLGPFTPINCSTYSDELLGSELFGSKPGAFTGSVDRPGFFENSKGGTLFLDEIGELSLQGQACLLRVIEERNIRRIGSLHTIPIDVRILAATNKPLRFMKQDKLFRSDLFYRLNLLGINIPPLRKRKVDIPCIARYYLDSISCKYRLDPGAVATLVHHAWPGNIRELQSVLLKASLTAKNEFITNRDIHIE